MNENKIMLITGTRKGIGRYLAEYYTKMGLAVIGCSRSDVDFGLKRYQHFVLDISDTKAVKEMFSSIRKQYKRLDVLIHNAGVLSKSIVSVVDYETLTQVLDTNVVGGVNIVKNAVRLMQKKSFGRVINFSTINVPLAEVGSSIYGGSKAFIEQFCKVLAKEVAPNKITVNTLGLSFVVGSGMIEEFSEEVIEKTLNKTISKAPITFEDISNTIDFLISDKSGAITGQTLYLGGA